MKAITIECAEGDYEILAGDSFDPIPDEIAQFVLSFRMNRIQPLNRGEHAKINVVFNSIPTPNIPKHLSFQVPVSEFLESASCATGGKIELFTRSTIKFDE